MLPGFIARQPESRRFCSRGIYLRRCRFGCPGRDSTSVSSVARQPSLQLRARTVRSASRTLGGCEETLRIAGAHVGQADPEQCVLPVSGEANRLEVW